MLKRLKVTYYSLVPRPTLQEERAWYPLSAHALECQESVILPLHVRVMLTSHHAYVCIFNREPSRVSCLCQVLCVCLSLFIIMQVLYMSNNNVKDWGEFQKLAELSSLEDLLFVGESQRMGSVLWTIHTA